MQAIPDTGGGFSGFIAHALWQVYQYFPFSGTWDWLVLIIVLAALVRLLFLPHLWKAVQADMRVFSEQRVLSDSEISRQNYWCFFWDMFCMWMMIWFFHTSAGRTLLEERAWIGDKLPSDSAGALFWVSALFHFFSMAPFGVLADSVDKKRKSFSSDRSQPFPDRGLISLVAGGGVLVEQTGKGTSQFEIVPAIGMDLLVALVAHVFYWYWSIASLMIMLSFAITGVLMEGIRMWFVYLLHKKTFG